MTILDARGGYNKVASDYAKWHWSRFWERNEGPLVERWLTELEPGLLLDAGCGTGPYRAAVEKTGHRWVGIDLSVAMLRLQMEHGEGDEDRSGVPMVQGNMTALPFKDGSFDYLLCTRVLTHIRKLDAVMSEFARVTKEGGRLLITDVHVEHPYSHMSVKSGGEKVSIETYKHPISELGAAMSATSRLHLSGRREYGLADLTWSPDEPQFGKIYKHPQRKIFYACYVGRV